MPRLHWAARRDRMIVALVLGALLWLSVVVSLWLNPSLRPPKAERFTARLPGKEITIDFVRGGKKMSSKTKLVDRRTFFAEREKKAKAAREKKPEHVVLGITIEEDAKGTLAVGKLADLAVLDTDLFETPPSEWLGAQVDYTITGGRVVFAR